MMWVAVFCVWLHLHWKKRKSEIHILLKKQLDLFSLFVCVKITFFVFLRFLCIFKILQFDVSVFTRSHWYDLWLHFFSLMLHCLLWAYFTDVFRQHESLINSSNLLFFCSQNSLWLFNVELLMNLSADLCDHFLHFWISVTSVETCNLRV